MSSKSEILLEIDLMQTKLRDQEQRVAGVRGMREDVVRMLVPVQLDQLKILRVIAELLPE